ncbi:MAG: hypothetical protein L6264_13135 [Weeksellaceae bacterium]|nr:hypothetical protein [Bacteroidota bacterium]MCG2781882.1 hypothetical protein [Weeksellaceae bacterium]
MKRILVVSILMMIFSSGLAKAQMTVHKLIHAGYVYQNQSFGEVGGRLLFLNNDDMIYRLGASALMGVANSEFAIMPKVQGDILINFERNVDFYHAYYFLAGAEMTTKYFAPKIGATLFGIVDVTGGYAIPIDKNGINGKELKGFNFNFTLNLPLVMLHDLTKK